MLDTASNTISCTTPGFSIFGLFGSNVAAKANRPTSSRGRVVYSCKDMNVSNYNEFSRSNPELCVYSTQAIKVDTPNAIPVKIYDNN